MVRSFLIIGQSNMAGRGLIENARPLNDNNGKIKVLRNGRWQTIFRPVNPDRSFAGTCLAEDFALAYSLANPDVEVGIIPCADGGTNLDQWLPNTLLFDNAIFNAKLAMRTSHLSGILWHQGEADTLDELYPLYLEKLSIIMTELRRDLGEDLPIVVGGLGDFLATRELNPFLKNYVRINDALINFSKTFPRVAFASAEGLTCNPDQLHFNADSLKEFGLRYFKAFESIEDKSKNYNQIKLDDSKRTEMELL